MARLTSRLGMGIGLALFVVAGLSLARFALAHDNWPAPAEAKKLKNPVTPTPDNLATARGIWMDKCANCHGDKGAGDGPEAMMYDPTPSPLNDAHMMGEMTDGEIFWKIGEGRKPMPSFKKQLTDEQRWQVVNFVRTLAPKPAANPPAKPPAKNPPSGQTTKKNSGGL